MREFRYRAIGGGLAVIDRLHLAAFAPAAVRGLGVILTFHRVDADPPRHFTANRLLQITPDFLDRTLRLLRDLGYAIIALDAVPARLRQADASRPFAALTFDDAYRDTLEVALPVLERHDAPVTVFAVPGFADRTAYLWWLDLEEAVRRLPRIELALPTGAFVAVCDDRPSKQATFNALYRALRALAEPALRAAVAKLAGRAELDQAARVNRLCLDWPGLARLAAHPLVSIGAHTLSHPRLATLSPSEMRHEIVASRASLEERLKTRVRHLAYPVGDRRSAGRREFVEAHAQRFATALTTRPGVLHAAHAAHLTALPRVSVNGLFQEEGALRALLSGWPFALMRAGARLDVA